MHARLHPALGPARDAEQLDAVAQLLREGDVQRADPADALHVHGVEADGVAKGEGGEDGQLVRGVDTIDVGGRVGLGVAERLRLRQHVRELALLVAHGGQDVVAGAVQDAGHAADAVGGQPLAHGLDDGDAARDRRLERERGGARQGGAVHRQQRLVGSDHGAASRERGAYQLQRRSVGAADQLDHGVQAREARELHRVLQPLRAVQHQAAVAGAVPRGHGSNRDRLAGAPRDQVRVVVQQADHAGTDGAEPGDPDPHAQPLDMRRIAVVALRLPSPLYSSWYSSIFAGSYR